MVVLYNAGIVDCTVEELVSMDRKTKKILAMNGCLHTRSNVSRLYFPRKEGVRRLIGVEECLKEECKSLHGYLRNRTELMLRMVLKEKVLVEEENFQDSKKRWKEENMEGLLGKLQMWLERGREDGSRTVF